MSIHGAQNNNRFKIRKGRIRAKQPLFSNGAVNSALYALLYF